MVFNTDLSFCSSDKEVKSPLKQREYVDIKDNTNSKFEKQILVLLLVLVLVFKIMTDNYYKNSDKNN